MSNKCIQNLDHVSGKQRFVGRPWYDFHSIGSHVSKLRACREQVSPMTNPFSVLRPPSFPISSPQAFLFPLISPFPLPNPFPLSPSLPLLPSYISRNHKIHGLPNLRFFCTIFHLMSARILSLDFGIQLTLIVLARSHFTYRNVLQVLQGCMSTCLLVGRSGNKDKN